MSYDLPSYLIVLKDKSKRILIDLSNLAIQLRYLSLPAVACSNREISRLVMSLLRYHLLCITIYQQPLMPLCRTVAEMIYMESTWNLHGGRSLK